MRSFTIFILSLVVYTVSGAAIVSQDELTTGSTIENEETSVNIKSDDLLKTIDELLKAINSALVNNNQPQTPSSSPKPPSISPHPPSFGPKPFPGFRPHFDEDDDDCFDDDDEDDWFDDDDDDDWFDDDDDDCDDDDDDDDDEAWIEDHKHFGGFRGFGANKRFGGHFGNQGPARFNFRQNW